MPCAKDVLRNTIADLIIDAAAHEKEFKCMTVDEVHALEPEKIDLYIKSTEFLNDMFKRNSVAVTTARKMYAA